MARSVKQLSIRLPEPLYCEVAALSQRRGESMNQLVIAGLKRVLEQDLADEMRRAYDALADQECDAELFLTAQAEVLDGG